MAFTNHWVKYLLSDIDGRDVWIFFIVILILYLIGIFLRLQLKLRKLGHSDNCSEEFRPSKIVTSFFGVVEVYGRKEARNWDCDLEGRMIKCN